MSATDRAILDAAMGDRDAARAECKRLRQQLAAAEALVEGAAEAGAILDERIKELEGKLAAAEALNAEATKAGLIVDERIEKLQSQLIESRQSGVNLGAALAVHVARSTQQAAEIERLRQLNEDLNHELQELRPQAMAAFDRANHLDLRDDVRPQESELERRAWELFVSSMSGNADITPGQSFRDASHWMAYRDQRRTQSPSIDGIDSDKLGGTT